MTRSLHTLLPLSALVLAACAGDPGPAPQPALAPEAPTAADDLVVTLEGGEAPGEGLQIRWYRDDDAVDSLQNLDTVPAGRTAKGQTWQVVLSPRAFVNGRGEVAPGAQASVVIGNTAPEASVTISPQAPSGDQDLLAEPVGFDLDDDDVSFDIQWYRDGDPVEGATETTVSAELTEHGEVWEVEVVPSDGEAEGEVATARVDIANSRPVGESVVIGPGDPDALTTLVATPTGSDPDGDPLTWTYTWYVDGVAVPDQSTDELSEGFVKGESVHVQATPSDGFTDGEPVQSEAVVIGNLPPTATGASISPAEATETSVLSCVGEGYADPDGDPQGWQVTWSVRGLQVAEQPTLSGDWFDRGDQIGCTLRPFDGTDVGDAQVARPIVIRNTPPVLDSVAIDNTSPREGDVLTAVLGASRDADSDDVAFRYRWTVDGSLAGSGSRLTSSEFDRGDVVRVQVTPTDGTDDGAPVTSAAVTVLNTAPQITSLSLSPTSPRTAESVTVTPTATDADGDSVTYTYAWYVEGALTSHTSATLPASAFDKGDELYVVVTPTDGTDSGDAETSAVLTAVNTAPSLTGVSLSPSTVREGTTVSCVPTGFSDDDGDSPVYRYRWLVNGTAVSTASTLDGSDFDKGDTVICEVTPGDGTDFGKAVRSGGVSVANTAPSLTAVSLSTTSPATDDTVTATATGVTDVDGDSVTLIWRWKVNGTVIRTAATASRTQSLSGSFFDKKDTIVVEVTPDDGTTTGTMVSSPVATAVNTPPTLSIGITPSPARTRDTLTATTTATDLDGDSISYLFEWRVDGSIEGTGRTLSGSLFDKGDTIDLEVTALDGDSSVVRTARTAIVNTAPTAPSVSLTPAPDPRLTDPLTCVASGSADSDGDSLTYRYTWLRNGSTYSTVTSTGAVTIPASATSAGQTWECRAQAYDGTDTSAIRSGGTVRVRQLDSCKSYYAAGYRSSGSYTIYVGGSEYVVECDMSTAGGGWTVLVDLPSGPRSTSEFRGEWDANPINSMSRYGIVSGNDLRWAGGGSNTFDFNDEVFWPNGGEVYADINLYMYSHEDSSVFFWVTDSSGNDLNVLCRDGTTLGGSWPGSWSTTERAYMPGYTCGSRTGTGGGYNYRYHGVRRLSFSRTLEAFHFTSFQSDNGTGGDWSYLYDLRVMVR